VRREVAHEAPAIGQIDVVRRGFGACERHVIALGLEGSCGVDDEVDTQGVQPMREIVALSVDRDGLGAAAQRRCELRAAARVTATDRQLDLGILRQRAGDARAEVAVAAENQCLHGAAPLRGLSRRAPTRRLCAAR